MLRCRAVWWGETTQQCHVPGVRGHIAQHSTNKAGEGLWSLWNLLSCWTLFFQILMAMSCSSCSWRSSLLSHRELGPYNMAVIIGNNCATFVKCQHCKGVLVLAVTHHLQQSQPQTMHIFGLLWSLQFTDGVSWPGANSFSQKRNLGRNSETLVQIYSSTWKGLIPSCAVISHITMKQEFCILPGFWCRCT